MLTNQRDSSTSTWIRHVIVSVIQAALPPLTFTLPSLFFPLLCFSFLCCPFYISLKAIFPIHFFSPPHDSSHESLEKPDLLGKVLGKQ